MARVITITSGKGGVGKTTTTANLGTALAMRGHRVAVIDADIGLRNLDVVMGLENRIVYDLVDVIEGRARLRQALIKDKRLPELCLLPAAQTRDKDAVSPDQMVDLTNQLRADFDFVLVDSPAGIEGGFRNAIVGADEVIIVTTPEVSAVRDADRIVGLVEAAEKQTPRLIVNRLKPRLVNRGEMLSVDDVLELLAIDLIGIVPDDETIVTSTNRGEAAVYDQSSLAGKAFLNIARRLNGEEVPFMALGDQPGVLERFFGMFGRRRA
ncbi:MAG: septum site-determining protein MinD [Oscillochloridaceae bacterium umkhey_bin13]